MESQNAKVPEKNCPKSDDLYLSQDLTEKDSIDMSEPRDELVTDAGNYEEGDIIQQSITVNPGDKILEGATLSYIKTTGPSMKNLLDGMAKKLAEYDRKLKAQDEKNDAYEQLKNQHRQRKIIFSVVEAGLALEDRVLYRFYRGKDLDSEYKRARHLDNLSNQEKRNIADSGLYKEALIAFGDDFKALVDYRNTLAHPCKLLVEIEIMEKCECVVDDIDEEMFEKAVALKNRLKQVPNIESIIENYRKRKLEEMNE